MTRINNTNGFTLIEVMIASFVLAVGILAMSLMQIKSMDANASAFSRSDASVIAQNFLEKLKQLPFTDQNLSEGATPSLNAGAAVAGGAPNPGAAAHWCNKATILAAVIGNNAFTLNGDYLVDPTGRKFQLFWNVDKTNTQVTVGGTTYTPYCVIRLFLYWNTAMGLNHLQLTTVKYDNS